MNLPNSLKSKWVVFGCASAVVFFGLVTVIFALERTRASHRWDYGFLAGIGFVLWGAWTLLTYKSGDRPR